jgi:hypothetical protein
MNFEALLSAHFVENVPAHFPSNWVDKARIVPDFFPSSGRKGVVRHNANNKGQSHIVRLRFSRACSLIMGIYCRAT